MGRIDNNVVLRGRQLSQLLLESRMTGEKRLAPSTVRGQQIDLRLFTEFLADNARYGWISACDAAFGPATSSRGTNMSTTG